MNQSQDQRQSVMTHLLALRKILVSCAASIAAAFFLIFSLAIDPLMGLILQPITARGIEVIYTAMSEALTTKMKVALIAAVVVSSPIVFWQIWSWTKRRSLPDFFTMLWKIPL